MNSFMRVVWNLLINISFLYGEGIDLTHSNQDFFLEAKRITIPGFPGAFNPSLLEWGDGFLLTFRHSPNFDRPEDASFIGIVRLDAQFNLISSPQILSTRPSLWAGPSRSEDARLFSFRGRPFLIFNDCIESEEYTPPDERRDLYLSELFCEEEDFFLSMPQKLTAPPEHEMQRVQKNWVPFVWKGVLFMSYSLSPHEVLFPDGKTGQSYPVYVTEGDFLWKRGAMRGGTPALRVDGQYLAFFHSSEQGASSVSGGQKLWHYFMGAYTFSADPPFAITSMSSEPIVWEGLYGPCRSIKRVVFPSGLVVKENQIYLAYGRNDCEVWIATLDRAKLMGSLLKITPSTESKGESS